MRLYTVYKLYVDVDIVLDGFLQAAMAGGENVLWLFAYQIEQDGYVMYAKASRYVFKVAISSQLFSFLMEMEKFSEPTVINEFLYELNGWLIEQKMAYHKDSSTLSRKSV